MSLSFRLVPLCLFCYPPSLPIVVSPLRFHRLQSLKFHVASQFSTSYYDAYVFRSSSFPRLSEPPLIRSSFRVFFVRLSPIHYITGPHVICVESSPYPSRLFHLLL